MSKRKVRALVLFSGGLDSMMAVKLLQDQDIEVEAICFVSNFFNSVKAERGAKILEIRLHIVDISREILKLVKDPPNGHGKNYNPCIDCHGLMIKKAGEFLERSNKFDFLASGEVLGQRPFSQNKESLKKVSDISGYEILRPLSAKLLDETEVERKRLVKREKLANILGRRRDIQFELARKYKIEEYPSPAGGCLLTDPQFSNNLGEMIQNWSKSRPRDIELLKTGRIYWLNLKKEGKALVVVGRNEEENKILEKIRQKNDFVLKLKDIDGPTTLVRFFDFDLSDKVIEKVEEKEIKVKIPKNFKKDDLKLDKDKTLNKVLEISGLLTGWYYTRARGKKVNIKLEIK